jgi:hypothetical protein
MLREIFDLLDNDVVGMDDIEKIFYAARQSTIPPRPT